VEFSFDTNRPLSDGAAAGADVVPVVEVTAGVVVVAALLVATLAIVAPAAPPMTDVPISAASIHFLAMFIGDHLLS
jgi:hypothetical protein